MADKKSAKRIIKRTETVRERTQQAGAAKLKTRRLRVTNVRTNVARPFKVFGFAGRFILPKFLRNAFNELRMVTWPDRKETWKLTSAVFVFAIAFGAVIAATDFVLDKLFRAVILK